MFIQNNKSLRDLRAPHLHSLRVSAIALLLFSSFEAEAQPAAPDSAEIPVESEPAPADAPTLEEGETTELTPAPALDPAPAPAPAAEPEPSPEPETSPAPDDDEQHTKKKKGDEEPGGSDPESSSGGRSLTPTEFKVKARVISGWEYEDERPRGGQPGADQTDFGFFLQQARLGVEAEWGKTLELELEADFSSASPLRDAYLNYRFARAMQLRVGRFKRPFSRLELVGAGRLPIRSRGLGNALIVEDMGFGDRSVGVELWGQLRSLGLDWSFSASNPPPNQPGVDLHARLAYDAAKWLEIGIGGAHKIVDNRATLQRDFIAGNAASADFRVRHGELYLVVDGMLGESLAFPSRPLAGTVGGYATYDVAVGDSFSLQPVLSMEWVDSDLEFSRSEAIRAVIGLNGLWQGHTFRVMPQVELVRPLDPAQATAWVERDTFYVMFSGQL